MKFLLIFTFYKINSSTVMKFGQYFLQLSFDNINKKPFRQMKSMRIKVENKGSILKVFSTLLIQQCEIFATLHFSHISGDHRAWTFISVLHRGTFKKLLLELLLKMRLFCAVLVGLCELEPRSTNSLVSQHRAK